MKKYMAIFLSLIIAVTCFAGLSVSAASDSVIGADDTAAKAGEDVTVSVKFNNEDGNATKALNTIYFKVSFDKSFLTLKSVNKKISLPSGYKNVFVDTGVTVANQKGFYVIGWNPETSATAGTYAPDLTLKAKDVLADFVFTIKQDAAAGTSSDVTVTELVAYNKDHTNADGLTVKNSKVGVACTTHDFSGGWAVTTIPGCTTKGEEQRSCSVCGFTETKDIPASGHSWGSWSIVTAATCEAKGQEQRVCENDATHIEKRDIAATGHKWGEWKVTTVPTAEAEGERSRVCENNQEHKESVILAKLNTEFKNEDESLTVIANEGTYVPADMTVEAEDITSSVNDTERAGYNKKIKSTHPNKEMAALYRISLLSQSKAADLNGGSYTATLTVPTLDGYTDIAAFAYDIEGKKLEDTICTISDGKVTINSSSAIAGVMFIGTNTNSGSESGVTEDGTSPKTGDEFMMSLALVLLMISAAGVVVTMRKKRA